MTAVDKASRILILPLTALYDSDNIRAVEQSRPKYSNGKTTQLKMQEACRDQSRAISA